MAVSQRQQVDYFSLLERQHFGLKSNFDDILINLWSCFCLYLLCAQVVLPSNGPVQGFGLMHSQPYPGMMPLMGQPHTAFPSQNDTFNQLMAGHQHQVK